MKPGNKKFFLNYAIAMHDGTKADNKLKGDCKRIFNEFLTARDRVFLALLLYNKQEQMTFILFCAAENNEL